MIQTVNVGMCMLFVGVLAGCSAPSVELATADAGVVEGGGGAPGPGPSNADGSPCTAYCQEIQPEPGSGGTPYIAWAGTCSGGGGSCEPISPTVKPCDGFRDQGNATPGTCRSRGIPLGVTPVVSP